MTLLLRKLVFDNLSAANQNGVREIDPALLLGVPRIVKDAGGAKWESYTSGQFTRRQMAMIGAMTANMDQLTTYDSPHVTDDGEITDREAYHKEMVGVLQDESKVNHPMTLPGDVPPSDPEAEVPSLEDVLMAQEPSDMDFEATIRLVSSLEEYKDVT